MRLLRRISVPTAILSGARQRRPSLMESLSDRFGTVAEATRNLQGLLGCGASWGRGRPTLLTPGSLASEAFFREPITSRRKFDRHAAPVQEARHSA